MDVVIARVRLANLLNSGDETNVTVTYEGSIERYEEVFPYVKDSVRPEFTIIRPDAFSYPILSPPDLNELLSTLPTQRFNYELQVTVPQGLVAASTGKLLQESIVGDGVKYAYVSRVLTWRIDLIVAKYGVMHDEGLNVRVYHFVEGREGASKVLKLMREAMNLYCNLLGEPPQWFGYGVVEVPEGYGSQASPEGLLITRDAFTSEEGAHIVLHEVTRLWNIPTVEKPPKTSR